MSKRAMVLLGCVLVVLILLSGCQAPPEQKEAKPVAVEVKPVQIGDVTATTVLSGPVRAQAEVLVISKLPLQVREINVEVGQAVEAGQVLLKLDQRDLVEQVRQAEAAVAVAEAGLPPLDMESAAAASARLASEQAAADLARLEHLQAQGVISDQALEQAKVGAAER